jgi:hypothetical protein
MNIADVPLNRFLGIRKSEGDGTFLLEMDDRPEHRNHLDTVHAGAQLALAEASSAEYLLRTFKDVGDEVFVVVRRVEAKFKKLVKGTLRSRAHTSPDELRRFSERLGSKGIATIEVSVDIVDAEGVVAMSALISWFIQKQKKNPDAADATFSG